MGTGMMTGGAVRHVDIDPVSRVCGALSFHAAVGANGAIAEANALGTLFRGYENILLRRDFRDATFISSRACGACGSAHSIASAQACEMAAGVAPTPMAIGIRNLMQALEHLIDYPLQMFVRIGPDYSEATVRDASPELWSAAESTSAEGQAIHKFKTIAEIMTALTPQRGDLWREAFRMSRGAREAYVLVGGKYPHPETMIPAGVSATIDVSDMNLAFMRVIKFTDYAQRAVAVWNDLVDFYLRTDARYGDSGVIAPNFIDLGLWDDPLAYDARYENAGEWGERRWATPGVIANGALVTTRLPEIEAAVEEHVDRSFYDDWGGGKHPSQKQTLPHPQEARLSGKYSWSTAPRWHSNPMDTGAGARLWITAKANRTPWRRFLEPTGSSLRMSVPRAVLAPTVLEWHTPAQWSTMERNRARAYSFAHSVLVAYEQVLATLDMKRGGQTLAIDGESPMSRPFKAPRGEHNGVGMWGSGRGYLSHHLSMDGGVIRNYQIIGPSGWTMSPRDGYGVPGPCEQAVASTQLMSRGSQGGLLDILRTIRSFDPCMACAAH